MTVKNRVLSGSKQWQTKLFWQENICYIRYIDNKVWKCPKSSAGNISPSSLLMTPWLTRWACPAPSWLSPPHCCHAKASRKQSQLFHFPMQNNATCVPVSHVFLVFIFVLRIFRVLCTLNILVSVAPATCSLCSPSNAGVRLPTLVRVTNTFLCGRRTVHKRDTLID